MRANFEIHDFRELRFAGRLIDLPHNFNFRGFDYDLQKGEVKLYWVKGSGDWIAREEYGAFTILHAGVTYFKVLLSTASVPVSDIQTLSELTFYPSSRRDENEQLAGQTKPGPADDIIYSFVGGPIIRIGCDEVSLLR